jgi:hypothetical protein
MQCSEISDKSANLSHIVRFKYYSKYFGESKMLLGLVNTSARDRDNNVVFDWTLSKFLTGCLPDSDDSKERKPLRRSLAGTGCEMCSYTMRVESAIDSEIIKTD